MRDENGSGCLPLNGMARRATGENGARASARKWLPRLLPLLVAAAALVIYLSTLVPDLTWAYDSADGAELISAACTLGVPHPPGYPTYVLMGRVVCALPLEPIARSFHLFSAVAVAVAAGFVTATAHYRIAPTAYTRRGAVAAGLFFAWLLPVWQQGVVAEVYALNLAVLAVFLWSLLGRRPAWLSGLLLGLSITTHLTSVFMLPLALWVVPRRHWPLLAAGLFLGLIPFLVLPLLGLGNSPVVWGRPWSPAGWWWLVSARLYRPNLLALPPDRWIPRLVAWGHLLLPQLAGAALLLGAAVRNRATAATRGVRTRVLLLPLLLYLIHAFLYDARDSVILLLPGLLLLSLSLARTMHRRPNLALFLPILLLLLNFSRFKPVMVTPARMLAETVRQQAPPGAILLTAGDRSTFPLWYLQSVEGERPDVTIVDRHLLGFTWYRERLQQLDPELEGLARYDLEYFRRRNQRVICDVNLAKLSEEDPAGVVSCLDASSDR